MKALLAARAALSPQVRLLVGVRERFSQEPVPNRKVTVRITEYPK